MPKKSRSLTRSRKKIASAIRSGAKINFGKVSGTTLQIAAGSGDAAISRQAKLEIRRRATKGTFR